MLKRIALALPAVAVLLLAGCVTVNTSPQPEGSPTNSAPAPSASSTPTEAAEQFDGSEPAGQCLTENLRVSIEDADSSAGHLHARVVFTNHGPACVLSGFPVVQVTSAGADLGVAANEDSAAPVAPVNLDSGGMAAALLTSVNIEGGGGPLGDSCAVAQGDGYNITPPHSLTPIALPLPGVSACTSGTSWMTVGAVTAP